MIFVLLKIKQSERKLRMKNELEKLKKKRIVVNLSKPCAKTAAGR